MLLLTPSVSGLFQAAAIRTGGHPAGGWLLPALLSVYREVEELLPERGLSVDHVTVWRVGAALRPRNSAPMATPRSFVARLGSVCRSCRPNGHYLHPNRIFMKTPSNSSPATFIEGALGRIAPTVLRWALGATLLSAVADRFGLWGPPGGTNVSWGDWAHFVAYTAKVNSFLPPPLLRGSRSLPRRSSLRSVWSPSWSGSAPGRLGDRRFAGAFRRGDDDVLRHKGAA
jgi:hypothetical protein